MLFSTNPPNASQQNYVAAINPDRYNFLHMMMWLSKPPPH